jgi:hypothetical protein
VNGNIITAKPTEYILLRLYKVASSLELLLQAASK